MSIIIKTLTKKDEPKWDQYVRSSQASTIYHTLLWRNISVKSFKHKPVFIFAEKDNAVVGVFPLFLVSGILGKRLVSVPLRDRGGPIYDNLDVLNLLIEESKKICIENNCEYLEIKSLTELGSFDKVIEKKYWKNTVVNLEDNIDNIFKKFSKGHKAGIKFASTKGVRIHRAKDIGDINEFYRLFLKTRKKLGVPPFNINFFLTIWNQLKPERMVELLIAQINDMPIAGIILFPYKTRVIYAYGASDENYLHLRANNLLQWEAIKFAHRDGFKYYDSGATSPETPGLLRFKKSFGAIDSDMPIYYFLNKLNDIPNMDSNTKKYKLIRWLFKKMPIFISKKIGPLIAKQVS